MKNIIFDFGNVLGRFDIDLLTAPYVDSNEEIAPIRDVVFDRIYWDNLDRGAITDEYVKEDICKRLPESLHRKAVTVYENWVNTMSPMPYMTDLVRELKEQGHKLYLLSNISLGFANTYHTVPWMRELFSHFDGLVLSATTKMAKPDREIFEYVLEKYDLEAQDCLFVDDNRDNVAGAEKAGITPYFFDGDVAKLRQYLEL